MGMRALIIGMAFSAAACAGATGAAEAISPWQRQVRRQIAGLEASSPPADRHRSAEALGMMRAYEASGALRGALRDPSWPVRCAAALSLGWCGGREDLSALLGCLDDEQWQVRQAAWVALMNITGMDFPFDGLAVRAARDQQADRWRRWIRAMQPDQVPRDVLDLLPVNFAAGRPAQVTATYKGGGEALTDGNRQTFWQTKHVGFPQACTIDLGADRSVGCIEIQQYADAFRMTEFAVEAASSRGEYELITRRGQRTQAVETIRFAVRPVRFVRITAYNSANPTYPTTIREIQVGEKTVAGADAEHLIQRAVRAMGALGGDGASRRIITAIDPMLTETGGDFAHTAAVRTGLRALGRLHEPAGIGKLIEALDQPMWARDAADALGDVRDHAAVAALIAAYPDYAMSVDAFPLNTPGGKGSAPARLPADDRPALDSADRMYETPWAMLTALARRPIAHREHRQALRRIAPLLLANLPSSHDAAVIYEPEPYQRATAWLLDQADLREAACATALRELGESAEAVWPQPERDAVEMLARRHHGAVPFAAVWLSALCDDSHHTAALIRLLEHADGWVRIEAARALMFAGARDAAPVMARLLESSRTEAEYGYMLGWAFDKPAQGHDEYDDPSPRWREAMTRGLGRLGGAEHVPLLVQLLNDPRNALEIQYAAARALDELGGDQAIDALRRAESRHDYHSIRMIAREALWRRGLAWDDTTTRIKTPKAGPKPLPDTTPQTFDTIVLIRGPVQMPNRFQIDPWRQTYTTTDSGPTYRLGKNLYLLHRSGEQWIEQPLTRFDGGWVADCEVSWDGKQIIFARREADDPWWQVWRIDVDGSNLIQLTRGPYHHVQPAFLPDGRIVLSTTRLGVRDEYHGYLSTGLAVMNADGGGLHTIGFNFSRDNEPAVLPDGRIAFSRLDLFYARLKTELTLAAIRPDGTQPETIYGPERRAWWHQINRQYDNSGTQWAVTPMRHRVLRLTQVQPWDDARLIAVSSAGLVLVGPDAESEQLVPHDRNWAVTTPWPLGDGTLLCAAADKAESKSSAHLAIYRMNVSDGKMTLLYRHPHDAVFEARPVMARKHPPTLADSVGDDRGFTGTLMCASTKVSRVAEVAERGRLVRVVEGTPVVGRHATQHAESSMAWKNHVGTLARVLGTYPLAADGSFYVQVPADRLLFVQVLDSDRQILSTQQFWMYVRPGEQRSCVGCHEPREKSPPPPLSYFTQAATQPPAPSLPTGDAFTYRAKLWQKGELKPEADRRTQTVRAVSVPARP